MKKDPWRMAGTIIGILIVVAFLVVYALAPNVTEHKNQSSGSQTHTECYQSTAVVPGYSGTTIIHENILYDAHNNILSRQSSLGSC